MTDGSSGLNQREREPRPEREQDQRQAPSVRVYRRPVRRMRLSFFALAVSVAALIVAGIALFFALRKDDEPSVPPDPPPEEETGTFRFGDKLLTPIEGIPLNSYDKTAFGLDGKGRVTYEVDGRRAKTGIDVSSHQQDIDWRAVAADGIDFAIIRLGRRGYTEGGLFLDEAFVQNLQGALEAGVEVGVYFFSQAVTSQEAEEEADFVMEALSGREQPLLVAYDWENIPGDDARTDGMSGAEMTRCAAAFCKRIEAGGFRPAVYFNRTQGYLRYDLRELAEYDLWLAEYGTAPDFYYHFDLWQYSQSGKVDGIEGDVDLNLVF